ncbi:sulfite exporter TauE/SafE family protein [Lentzea sp. BCCO 10_0798]|uniref:Sulfite exporter TauE/SafE family protein n=1 Tax=Lentzea kristufekii TaxID=3095430 RepID=A0ABU4U191_9PSEU|nr:sulfite exporter TauE/SafE family protein [Lentzea sp. BCCO 10_0798]MDX8054337.1 sulfite exporter TauE/SafE family protein [Lentzea sp. BCCO 10_0798]
MRVFLLVLFGMLLTGGVAQAHPLSNLSVNHYDGLRVFADRIELRSVVDSAEIPTLQDREFVDARKRCAERAKSLTAMADEQELRFEVRDSGVVRPPGEAGLPTMRLTCEYTAPLPSRGEVEVTFSDSYLKDKPGWREITVVGVDVSVSGAPAESVSNELRTYPDDLLSSPLDVRAVRFLAQPGEGSAVTPPGVLGEATKAAVGLVGDLTPVVGVGAVLLSLVLGASHAALPGHGKTVMAAYLAGSRGTRRDALLVGATVTITHTAGVLVLGLLLSASSAIAGESVLRWLGLASGLLVAVIGGVLLRSAVRSRGRQRHDLGHGHGHGHGHGRGHGHRHRRAGLVGMGVAGGLVPSPSALVVLLGAIALGRTWFGVVLVLAYGLGMAATLTAAGLLLVSLRDRFGPRLARFRGFTDFTPFGTAALVTLVGVGLAARALAG